MEEIPLYAPSGAGEHTFVEVEKRLRTTEEVARDLAAAAGVAPREIGYAGRKDRYALARQWLSVPGLAPERALSLALPGARVLAAVPHPHKLRTGQLRGNRFALTLHGLADDAPARLGDAAGDVLREGVPNAFGAQRFGRDGDNAERGLALLRGAAPGRDRRRARFLLSALQAAGFNAVLATRPRPLSRLEAGDVAWLHESGACFRVDDPGREQPRADAGEISPTGPMFGTRMLAADGAPGARERRALASLGVDPDALSPPRGLRLRGARRPLRVLPRGCRVERVDAAVRLRFELPAGSFATVCAGAWLEAAGLLLG